MFPQCFHTGRSTKSDYMFIEICNIFYVLPYYYNEPINQNKPLKLSKVRATFANRLIICQRQNIPNFYKAALFFPFPPLLV